MTASGIAEADRRKTVRRVGIFSDPEFRGL